MFTKTTERTLSDRAIARILVEHERRIGPRSNPTVEVVMEGAASTTRDLGLPPIILAYSLDGSYVGVPGAHVPERPSDRFQLDRHILIDDDYLPPREHLEAVRITEDGVVMNGYFRKPPPAPPVKPGPSDDEGRPLDERVIQTILRLHREAVAKAAMNPAPVGYDPVIPLAFTVTGQYAGTLLDWQTKEHAHELVVLSSHEIPTADDLRRLRVHRNGWITKADA